MPVTAGPVPGLTSGLRRAPMNPGRFRSGRWLLLGEGVLVSAFGVAGLVSATLHPHAGPTGAPVLGLASAPAHSAMLLAFGVVAIAAVANRRAAVTVTALSAVAYTVLLFFSSVATARTRPTPLGFHAADIVLHGVLAVVNLALLMWLIPDELGDETWVPRRRSGRGRDRRRTSVPETAGAAAAARGQESGAHGSPPQNSVVAQRFGQQGSTHPPVRVGPAHRAPLEQSGGQEANEPPPGNVENSEPLQHFATRANWAKKAASSRGALPVIAAALAAVVGIVIWMRRRRRH